MLDALKWFRPLSILQLPFRRKPVKNVNAMLQESLSPLERAALVITNHVGTMGFFLLIFSWTILWCGYNILATRVPSLHWRAFDPFPAFVAYLLISNVIQIMLMPLIMVGQNLQGRHSELRAENDFEVNVKAEMEVAFLHEKTDRLYEKMQEQFSRLEKSIGSSRGEESMRKEAGND